MPHSGRSKMKMSCKPTACSAYQRISGSLSDDMELKYGQTSLNFNLGESADIFRIRDPEKRVDPAFFKMQLEKALGKIKPDLADPVVIVGDKTRLCGYPEFLPTALESLLDLGASREKIRLFIAYGTHPRQSEEESLNAYGPVYHEFSFIHHDCLDADSFEQLGVTSRGTEVYVRKEILQASFILGFGAISHHYFAGYGGGRKLIFPGLGYRPAIYQNHGLFLDRDEKRLARGCRAGQLDGNPLAEDLFEVERHRSADLSIHGILNSSGEVCDLLIGKGESDFRRACGIHGEHCERKQLKQYDLVVASCGGFPKDINFIQAHKAVHNAAFFVRDGGDLIVLAECRDGIGSKTFLPWFEMGGYTSAFAKLTEHYEGNGGTALATMEKTERIDISLVTDMEEELTSSIGISKVNLQKVRERLALIDHSQVAVIPNASLLVKK